MGGGGGNYEVNGIVKGEFVFGKDLDLNFRRANKGLEVQRINQSLMTA